MNKKTGFTLVEIISVILLIAVLGILIVPKVATLINESKTKGYNTTISTIKDAAKTYTYLKTNEVDDKIEINSYYDISVLKLQQEGLLSIDLKDARTNTNISTLSGIRITKTDNKYEYTYLSTLVDTSLVKLTVDLNGGSTSQIFSPNYSDGSTITLINPTRNGYIFSNWTVSGQGSYIVDEVLTIGSANTTITSNWVKGDYYRITYTLNGGVVDGINPVVYTGNDDTITLINPTRVGYTFSGWTGSNGMIPQMTITIPTGSIGTKNYTANWTANTYVVKYNCNGAGGATANSLHAYGTEKTLSPNGCIKAMTTGSLGIVYYFNGWATSPTATSIYENEASVLNLTSINNDEVTLYATWDILFSYTGTYNLSGTENNWKLKFTSSGTFNINKSTLVDIFVVGGGGGGAGQTNSSTYSRGGGGGGGGYAKTYADIPIFESYQVIIGSGGAGGTSCGQWINSVSQGCTAEGGSSSSFGIYTADGGKGGKTTDGNSTQLEKANGGKGGSGGGGGGYNSSASNGKGGIGGTDGANGGDAGGTSNGGIGQDNIEGYEPTTREFGDAGGDLYSGGGAGGSNTYRDVCSAGGSGGGGAGGCSTNLHGSPGGTNTGGGGGGAYGIAGSKYAGSAGGSGIVIIRNAN